MRIEKHRYESAHGDRTTELDIFEGRPEGLMVAEVEFPSENAANGFGAAEWFGEELTGKQGWSNAELARHGIPWRGRRYIGAASHASANPLPSSSTAAGSFRVRM